MNHRASARGRLVTAAVLAVLTSMSATLVSAHASSSASWPQVGFDPARTADNGSETALSQSTITSLHQTWSSTGVQDGIIPSLVAGDGLLFVSYAASDPAGQEGIHARNLVTGAAAWFYHFSPGSKYAPALSGHTLYVSTARGLLALNAATGALLWRSSVGGSAQAVASPLVANGTVYLASGATALRAVNAVTGATQWSVPLAAGLAGPLAYQHGVLYATTSRAAGITNLVVEAHRATDGAVLWSRAVADTSASFAPTVTLGTGVAFVNAHNGVWALHVSDGSTAWHATYPRGDAGYGTLALDVAHDTLISGESDALVAWRASTGSALWRTTTFGGGSAIANGVVYDFGAVLNEYTGAVLWAYPSGFWSVDEDGVLVTGGHLYVNGYTSGASTFDTYSFGLH